MYPLDSPSYRTAAPVTAVVFPPRLLFFPCDLIKQAHHLADPFRFTALGFQTDVTCGVTLFIEVGSICQNFFCAHLQVRSFTYKYARVTVGVFSVRGEFGAVALRCLRQ